MRPKVQEGAAAYSQSSFIRCSRRGARRKKIRVAQISGITDLAAPTYVSNEHLDVILTDPRKMKIERNWNFENSLWASLFNLREMRLKPKRQFTCSRNSHLASPYLLKGHLYMKSLQFYTFMTPPSLCHPRYSKEQEKLLICDDKIRDIIYPCSLRPRGFIAKSRGNFQSALLILLLLYCGSVL